MFSINYEILEEEKNRILKLKDVMEFESDVNTIMGQIELIFNNRKEGFVDKDIPFSGEFLITWLKRLNDVLIQLKISQFVAMELPDSDSIWFEFKLDNEEVLISEIRSEKEIDIEEFIVICLKKEENFFGVKVFLKKNYLIQFLILQVILLKIFWK